MKDKFLDYKKNLAGLALNDAMDSFWDVVEEKKADETEIDGVINFLFSQGFDLLAFLIGLEIMFAVIEDLEKQEVSDLIYRYSQVKQIAEELDNAEALGILNEMQGLYPEQLGILDAAIGTA